MEGGGGEGRMVGRGGEAWGTGGVGTSGQREGGGCSGVVGICGGLGFLVGRELLVCWARLK